MVMICKWYCNKDVNASALYDKFFSSLEQEIWIVKMPKKRVRTDFDFELEIFFFCSDCTRHRNEISNFAHYLAMFGYTLYQYLWFVFTFFSQEISKLRFFIILFMYFFKEISHISRRMRTIIFIVQEIF